MISEKCKLRKLETAEPRQSKCGQMFSKRVMAKREREKLKKRKKSLKNWMIWRKISLQDKGRERESESERERERKK